MRSKRPFYNLISFLKIHTFASESHYLEPEEMVMVPYLYFLQSSSEYGTVPPVLPSKQYSIANIKYE
jgi:hypothetical protein